MNKEITLEDYVLTNLHPGDWGYYIRLKDNIEYQVYVRKPRGQKLYYFIKKDNEEIRLDEEVRKCFLQSKREYERYRNMKDKFFTKIYRYIKNQDFTKLQKFIVKESNKNNKKIDNLKNFYDKNNWQQYSTYKKIKKIEIINKNDIDKWNIEELKERYLLLQDVCLKAGDLLIKYQKQLTLSDITIDKRNELLVEMCNNNIKKNKIIDLMAEQLAGLAIFDNDIENALILGDKEEVKKYYERKAANEEK